MVTEGLVDIVGTDHHGPRRTGVSPLEAFAALRARGEQALAERAMVERPGAVLRNEARGGARLRRQVASGRRVAPIAWSR